MEAAKGRELILESDIIIVGAGVVGCGLARVLSRYDCRVTVLEKADDVAEGASKANSGIVHAGFDAHPGTLKARLNVEGAGMYPELCKELGVPYSRPAHWCWASARTTAPRWKRWCGRARPTACRRAAGGARRNFEDGAPCESRGGLRPVCAHQRIDQPL